MRWRVRLEWVESGESPIPSSEPPKLPFWSNLSQPTISAPSTSSHPIDIIRPSSVSLNSPGDIGLSFLPQYLYAKESQWWHCTDCGKLNLTGWMGKHVCTFCQVSYTFFLISSFVIEKTICKSSSN